MKVTDFLSEELIITGMKPSDKPNLCEIMVDRLISTGKIKADRKKILIDKLMEREALSSTGVGGGVAIPHASGENIENTIVAIGQAPDGVDYEAIDNEPVNLVFMIIGSERVPRAHLQLLAAIVRACKNQDLVKSLTESDSPEEIYKSLINFDRG